MIHSRVINGRVLDYKFKKVPYGYSFHLNDEVFVGKVFFVCGAWTAVPYLMPNRMVAGFKTRLHAADYMLDISDEKLINIVKKKGE